MLAVAHALCLKHNRYYFLCLQACSTRPGRLKCCCSAVVCWCSCCGAEAARQLLLVQCGQCVHQCGCKYRQAVPVGSTSRSHMAVAHYWKYCVVLCGWQICWRPKVFVAVCTVHGLRRTPATLAKGPVNAACWAHDAPWLDISYAGHQL